MTEKKPGVQPEEQLEQEPGKDDPRSRFYVQEGDLEFLDPEEYAKGKIVPKKVPNKG